MVDRLRKELNVGDLVMFAISGGELKFGTVTKFYKNADKEECCSVINFRGYSWTNVKNFRVIKIDNLAQLYREFNNPSAFLSKTEELQNEF